MLRSNLKSRYLLRSSRLTFVSTFNFYLSSYRYICNWCIVPLQCLLIIATDNVPFLDRLVTWSGKEHPDAVQHSIFMRMSKNLLCWTIPFAKYQLQCSKYHRYDRKKFSNMCPIWSPIVLLSNPRNQWPNSLANHYMYLL